MNFAEILPNAEKYKNKFAPYCDRIEIAGSIRRQCSDCGDIEIVYIPNKHNQWALYDMISGMRKVKGDPFGKYTQRIVEHGLKIDIFRADPQNWGLILAIRTGSADYSKALASEWVRKGYHSKDGMLRDKRGKEIPILEEICLFELLNMDYVSPERRS
jgi:DNA polymerase/3'-5' exonuclease PolX